MISRIYRFTCIVALLVILPVFTSAALADDGEGPVPLHKQGEYPRGKIDWLEGDKIVIEDTEYTILPQTRILDSNSAEVGSGYLSVDMHVAFEPGDNYTLLIVQEMVPSEDTLAADQRDDPSVQQPQDTAPVNLDTPEGIYQEGGVWKN